MCRFITNKYLAFQPDTRKEYDYSGIIAFHSSLPDYRPTPLLKLESLAEKLEVGGIYVKDESRRFDLKAFKCMGASYAIYRLIKERWEKRFGVLFDKSFLFQKEMIDKLELPVFATATDGNHGRAVAWFSNLTGQQAVIYMPRGTVKARIENIEKEKAKVIIVDGDYDLTVKQVSEDAERFGYQVIADTAYEGYHDIPAYITDGYTTIFSELPGDFRFDFGLVQSGVGSFAASALLYFKNHPLYHNTKWINVEPTEAACLFDSVESPEGERTKANGNFNTIMAGLNCGTPSEIAWPVIRDMMDGFLTVSDEYAERAMRQYYYPENDDPRIISGESGSAGLAGLMALLERIEFRKKLGIDESTVFLLFNTEGDTDPENFQKIICDRQ